MKKGFTLIEILISVGLLALIAIISTTMIVNLVRSSAKLQSNIDIDHTSNFVFSKIENDIRKSYSVSVSSDLRSLVLYQTSSGSPKTISYSIREGCNGSLNCIIVNYGSGDIKLTDDTTNPETGTPTISAVNVDTSQSSFSLVTDSVGSPVAVNIRLSFFKPLSSGSKVFDSRSMIDTTVVIKGSY